MTTGAVHSLSILYYVLGLFLAFLIAAPASTKALANAWKPHILCDGGPDFCQAIEQAQQRLRDTNWTRFWATWADENEVLIVEHPELSVPRQWWAKVWESHPTIWATTKVTGDAIDSAILVHELQHLMDGPECVVDPWSHERVLFWEMLAAYSLGERDYFWMLWGQQHRYEREARGLAEPCRQQDVLEPAPHGITYTWLKPLLGWWD